MSKNAIMWTLDRKITLRIGNGECGRDTIKTLRSKELFSSAEDARAQSNSEQAMLLSAMQSSREAIIGPKGMINIGGLFFGIADVKCAKFSVRPANEWEAYEATGVTGNGCSGKAFIYEPGTGGVGGTIHGAQCVSDDDDDDNGD